MEAAVLLWFHLLLSVIFCNGFHVQGPSDPLTVQLRDSVMLPCFVETPLPMEELEVEWKRIDSGSLVHLWQNGESRPESQNQRYHERAHFFSEEVAHGNFSLLLTNVTQEDAGVYKCVVHTNQHSDETLIKIMETERLIVSGGHVISAYAGEEITLNCSVDSHIPSEKIEEVSWKKQDEDLLLLLYQEGEILTESTHGRFKGRVEFFSAEDRNKGNFSMRLKDVRTKDRGLYICSAFSGDLSDNTTVEVQQLAAELTGADVVTHNKQTWQTDTKLSSEADLAAANDKLYCKFNLPTSAPSRQTPARNGMMTSNELLTLGLIESSHFMTCSHQGVTTQPPSRTCSCQGATVHPLTMTCSHTV
ncbi:hypothetical protein HF521_020188 [Silurus meridionalis]|uniref:Ig-like domain-containing protein n=1 Tax=Silurus meridionalis TaxID=175797 RepID=A0A8T0BCN2_SILME|nr:hypothetical protein HF521_020188 [Silurus meridionalis]